MFASSGELKSEVTSNATAPFASTTIEHKPLMDQQAIISVCEQCAALRYNHSKGINYLHDLLLIALCETVCK